MNTMRLEMETTIVMTLLEKMKQKGMNSMKPRKICENMDSMDSKEQRHAVLKKGSLILSPRNCHAK